MALPIAPTITSLCTEAYSRCGYPTPSSAQLSRAQREWLQGAITDLQGAKDWHPVEETIVVIPAPFVQVVAMPGALVRVLRMRFYRGTVTGTAQTGGTSTITVANGTGNAQHRGLKIFLLSGTGEAQSGRIVGVSGDVYTMSCPWDTQPSTDTVYLIAEVEQPINGPQMASLLGIGPGSQITHWDFIEHTLRFWPPLDDAGEYAIEIDGIVDLNLIDMNDARYVRILREWREPIIRGLMVYIKEDQDDLDDADRQERRFDKSRMRAMQLDVRKRLRGEAPAFRSMGGGVKRRRY